MDKLNSERAVFVSPYLNQRLRSFDEVMEARQRQEICGMQGEELAPASRSKGGVRLRLVYARPEGASAATAG